MKYAIILLLTGLVHLPACRDVDLFTLDLSRQETDDACREFLGAGLPASAVHVQAKDTSFMARALFIRFECPRSAIDAFINACPELKGKPAGPAPLPRDDIASWWRPEDLQPSRTISSEGWQGMDYVGCELTFGPDDESNWVVFICISITPKGMM
ncbi:MAG: hypothetical protein ACYS8X_13710 [Planctomycetota bacterium]|jgi:hypothetical protein